MATVKRAKPHPRFGATKAQGKRAAEIRDRENQIHELKNKLVLAQQMETVLRQRISVLETDRANRIAPPLALLDAVLQIPLSVAIDNYVLDALLGLRKWTDNIRLYERLAKVASGNVPCPTAIPQVVDVKWFPSDGAAVALEHKP